jgi:hypothetical protein
MNRVRSLGFKLYGAPPPKGSRKSQQLRWIRGFYLKPLPLVLVVDVMGPRVVSQPWVLVLLGAGMAIWLQGLISISLRIRREERDAR